MRGIAIFWLRMLCCFVAFEAAKLIHVKPLGGKKIMSPHPSFSVG